jgi:hypothetical protein
VGTRRHAWKRSRQKLSQILTRQKMEYSSTHFEPRTSTFALRSKDEHRWDRDRFRIDCRYTATKINEVRFNPIGCDNLRDCLVEMLKALFNLRDDGGPIRQSHTPCTNSSKIWPACPKFLVYEPIRELHIGILTSSSVFEMYSILNGRYR